MAKKNVNEEQNGKVIATVSKTEQFYNKNKKVIWGIIIAIVAIALLALGYRKFIYEPKAAEAAAQMYPAETAFINGDFEKALNGDGNNLGFAQILDEYGTKELNDLGKIWEVATKVLTAFGGLYKIFRAFQSINPKIVDPQ